MYGSPTCYSEPVCEPIPDFAVVVEEGDRSDGDEEGDVTPAGGETPARNGMMSHFIERLLVSVCAMNFAAFRGK